MLNSHRQYMEAVERIQQVLEEKFPESECSFYAYVNSDEISVRLSLELTAVSQVTHVLKAFTAEGFHQRKECKVAINSVSGYRSYELFVGTEVTLTKRSYYSKEQEEYEFVNLNISFRGAEGDACMSVGTGEFEQPREIMKFMCGQELEDYNQANA